MSGEFRSPCPAGDCDRTTPCRPPAPDCPHPWHAASKARIAARLAEVRKGHAQPTTDQRATADEESR